MKMKTSRVQVADGLEWTGERFVPELEGEIALEHIHRYAMACELAQDKVVLDIASGEGYGSAMLGMRAQQVLGVDISATAAAFSRKKYASGKLAFIRGSCSAIPLKDRSVDMIVSFETIEHHDQHEAMIKEFVRVLRPDGIIIISSPDKHEYSDVPQFHNPYHVKELYEKEFRELLFRHFQCVQMYGQRLVYGSAIFRSDNESALVKHFRSESDVTGGEAGFRPIYNIAIASNAGLPAAAGGFLEADICDSEKYRQKVGERELWWKTEVDRIAEDYKNEIARIGAERDRMLAGKDKDWQEEVDRVARDYRLEIERIGGERDRMLAEKDEAWSEQIERMDAGYKADLASCEQYCPLVSVIIVNYNGKRFFDNLLPSIAAQTYPNYEVIVVDNASVDGSVDYVRRRYPDIRVVEAGANLGFAMGNNLGIDASRGEFYALINNDTVVHPDWLGALVREAQKDAGIAAVGSKIVFFKPFVPVRITSPATVPGESRPSGDGRKLGVLFSDNSGFEGCSYRKRVYLDGFHAEECIDGQMARWTNGDAVVAVPVDAGEGVGAAVLKLQLAGGEVSAGSAFDVMIGDESVGSGVLEEGFGEYRFTVNAECIRKMEGNIINNAGSLLDKNGNARDRGMNELDRGQYDSAEDAQALCGGAMLVRKSAVDRVGAFDSDYFMYYEDTELSWRLRKAGYSLRYQPKSVVQHVHAGSSEEWSPTFKYFVWRNRVLMCVTHTSIANAAKVYFLEWVSIARLLVNIVWVNRKHGDEKQAAIRDLKIKLLIQRSLSLQAPKAYFKRLKLRFGR
ncbi:MAG: glycosyltransferase [Thiogranum sp.]